MGKLQKSIKNRLWIIALVGGVFLGICGVGAASPRSSLSQQVVNIHNGIEGVRTSIGKNYLGSKNANYWSGKVKELRVMNSKLPNGSTKDKYNTRLNDIYKVIESIYGVVKVEGLISKESFNIDQIEIYEEGLHNATNLVNKINKSYYMNQYNNLNERILKKTSELEDIISEIPTKVEPVIITGKKVVVNPSDKEIILSPETLGLNSIDMLIVSNNTNITIKDMNIKYIKEELKFIKKDSKIGLENHTSPSNTTIRLVNSNIGQHNSAQATRLEIDNKSTVKKYIGNFNNNLIVKGNMFICQLEGKGNLVVEGKIDNLVTENRYQSNTNIVIQGFGKIDKHLYWSSSDGNFSDKGSIARINAKGSIGEYYIADSIEDGSTFYLVPAKGKTLKTLQTPNFEILALGDGYYKLKKKEPFNQFYQYIDINVTVE